MDDLIALIQTPDGNRIVCQAHMIYSDPKEFQQLISEATGEKESDGFSIRPLSSMSPDLVVSVVKQYAEIAANAPRDGFPVSVGNSKLMLRESKGDEVVIPTERFGAQGGILHVPRYIFKRLFLNPRAAYVVLAPVEMEDHLKVVNVVLSDLWGRLTGACRIVLAE